MITRFLSEMFEEKRSRKYSNEIEYRLSYVEIFLNKINDLLVSKDSEQKFNIRDALKVVISLEKNK